MTRPHKSVGWVKWPDPAKGWCDDGQGGMAVYAVVQYPHWTDYSGEWEPRCPRASLSHHLLYINWTTKEEEILALVPLGASNWCWWHYDNPSDQVHSDCYPFRVTLDDLTVEGQALVKTLETLYGLPVVLATHIDT